VNSILGAKLPSVAAFLLFTLDAVPGEAKSLCTTRSIDGNYAYQVSGTNVGVGLVAAVGLVTADGEGTHGKRYGQCKRTNHQEGDHRYIYGQ
jgi:hypothetical protein